MTHFLVSRLLQTGLVLLVMSFVIYCLLALMPGDPIDLMIAGNPDLTPEDAARLRALHGLDLPIYERYLNWLSGVLAGDLGYSRLLSQPVSALLWPSLVNTLVLMGTAFVLALGLALVLSVLAMRTRGRLWPRLVTVFALAGISMPPFWLAIVLIVVFAVSLGWLPAGGTGPIGDRSVLADLPYLVLPVLTLVLISAGRYMRFLHRSLEETIDSDFIRTARSKGVSETGLIWGHALRSALIPVVTILALEFGTLLSGALVTETIFAWPGMGKLIYDAIMGNDFNLAVIGLLIATAATLLGNLLADVGYAWLDPRIRYGANEG